MSSSVFGNLSGPPPWGAGPCQGLPGETQGGLDPSLGWGTQLLHCSCSLGSVLPTPKRGACSLSPSVTPGTQAPAQDPGCPIPDPQPTPLTPRSTPAFLASSDPHLRERLLTFPQHFEISAVGRVSGSLSTTFLKPGTHSREPGMTQLSSPSAAFSLKYTQRSVQPI